MSRDQPLLELPAQSKKRIPVLIVPGFMSSVLVVTRSESYPSWRGKRIWLNLKSIGFYSLHRGGVLQKNAESMRQGVGDFSPEVHEEYERQVKAKSRWVQHIRLRADMKSEKEEISVRAIEGTAGVDYLAPGMLTKSMSYVFGPVLDVLRANGYKDGVDLDAAPYDWRLPPSELENRDSYFTATMGKIEDLYTKSGGTPVVLLCHSLGCKTAHYLLTFALQFPGAGQPWIDKFVHTYIPIGAPHIGSPRSVRGLVCGGKMGLDAFLEDEEGLIMSRSFGSLPWLFPSEAKLSPTDVIPCATVRRESVLRVTVTSHATNVSSIIADTGDQSQKLRLAIDIGNLTLRTEFKKLSKECVNFHGETFLVACPPEISITADVFSKMQIHLEEPGSRFQQPTKKKKGFCNLLLFCPFRVVKCLLTYTFCCPCAVIWKGGGMAANGVMATASASAGFLGVTRRIAHSAPLNISQHLMSKRRDPVEVQLEPIHNYTILTHGRNPTVAFNIEWEPPVSDTWGRDPQSKITADDRTHVHHRKLNNVTYDPCSINHLLDAEGLANALNLIDECYSKDPRGPLTISSSSAPPVKRVIAIHGINLPTEVGCVYRRDPWIRVDSGKVQQMFVLDKEAQLRDNLLASHDIEEGLIKEIKLTPQTIAQPHDTMEKVVTKFSGDGTVPYWSLQQCLRWQGQGARQCNVIVHELDQAEHRTILSDERLHKILVEILCSRKDEEL